MPLEQPQEENSYVIDTESAVEMARLIQLDRFTTQAMGGVFAGLPELVEPVQILDIACGPGGWVLDAAYAYPDSEVAGIDISKIMIDYARARARSQGLINASFELMDVTRLLDFSDNSFDRVNARLLLGVLRRELWPQLLSECMRILKPGGIFRWTESEPGSFSNSPAGDEFMAMCGKALWLGGYGFSSNGKQPFITHMLGRKLRETGFQNVQYRSGVLEASAGTPAWGDAYENMNALYCGIKPLLVKAGVAASQEELERLNTQRQIEMLSEDFTGLGVFVSAWGTKPSQ